MDFKFRHSGEEFLNSGASVTITNGQSTVGKGMQATSVDRDARYYFFGCVDVQTSGEFTFTPAPTGTFFDGGSMNKWMAMMEEHCGAEIEVPSVPTPARRPTTTPATTTTTTTTSTTTTSTYFANVGIKIIARNSQNNGAVSGAVGTFSLQQNGRLLTVAQDVSFGSDGTVFVPISSNGVYSIQIRADGFIDQNIEMTVTCTSSNCENNKLVVMSPVLPPGQTRIMMSWGAKPMDVDTHVMAIKNSNDAMCKTWYDNRNGCDSISQDLDNTEGGLNGAETVTLEDNAVNSDYTYLIAIEDYEFENNGQLFLNSGAGISITNGVRTIERDMHATTIQRAKEFYFFGCLRVSTEGQFTFTDAPAGTFFDGEDNAQWLAMRNAHCQA